MSKASDEYRRLAAAETERAEEATLPNVRVRALSAAEAWQRMAERAELAESNREGRNGN